MRLNQYEKSIYVLKENVPNFIRLAYSTFADLFNVLFEDCICEAAKEIPSSTRDVCSALLCCCDSRGVSFSDICFKYFTKINNIREFNEKLAKLAVHEKEEFSTSKEDIFFNVNDTDIEAPVGSIRGVFSLANEVVNSWTRSSSKTEVCEKIVPLIFQPKFSSYEHNNREDIKDLTGTDSILSHGTTELCIDLGALFDSFFEKAIDLSKFGEEDAEDAVVSTEGEVVSREIEENLEAHLDGLSSVGKVIQNKASDICEGITKTILASALATYTVYASKLIGSKQDIYDWAYKAFVKDSLSFIDVKDYINNADITRYSGHRVGEKDEIGKPYGMPASEATDTDGNIRTALNSGALNFNNGDLPISVKKIIYRSIRLQYSLWASVINSIFCTGKSDKTKPHSSTLYNTVDPVLGNRYDSLLDLSRAIFSSFAKARYRTFNTGTQFTEKREAVSSLASVDIGISKIVDQKAKEILKDSTKNFKISSLFFNDLNNSVILTEANNRAVNEIRKLFIQTAYLLMLNKINQNSGKILEDEDPITGKTRKELFNEIYYGISINLSKAINAISYSFDSALEVFKTLKDTGLSAFVSAVSPTDDIYGKLGAHIEHEKRFERMSQKVRDVVCYSKDGKPSLREMFDNDLSDTKEILRWFIMDRVLVPYYSDFLDIKSVSYKYQFVDRLPDEQPFTDFTAANKTGTLFPKNRIVVDQLNMVSKMQAEKNKYFTIESINSAMDDLEISMCAADAMANNGSYNALASIGSSISSLEISTDNADDAGHSPVDESDTRLNASDNPLEGTVTSTDANGTELGPNPTDAEDQRKFTVHDSMESAHASQMEELNKRFMEKTIERYNELFNKVIFNVEKK